MLCQISLEKVVELPDGAEAPPESLGGVPEVAHDEAVLPAALSGSGAAQVRGRRRAVVDSAEAEGDRSLVITYILICVKSREENNLQVSQLVRRDDDAREAPGVLHDGHAVDLLQALIDDAGAPHVGEPGRAAVTLAHATLATTHIQSGKRSSLLSFATSIAISSSYFVMATAMS